MNKQRETRIGKFLSYVLRHHPDSIGLTLEHNGWASVKDILNNSQLAVSFEELQWVVEHDAKNRFSFNAELTKLKANQGHSVNIELTFKAIVPPPVLYHGTALHFLESIQTLGLQKGNRHHVHLSKDLETAAKVGRRHGKLVILEINSQAMYETGYPFYISENDVYLVDEVPTNYLVVLDR